MKQKLINLLRKFVPRKALTLLKFYHVFNHKYGHSHFHNGLSHDSDDNPIPWITYPAIEFLKTLNLEDCHVFEYGSGSSTLFWSQHASSVTSVEKDPCWYEKIKGDMPQNANIELKVKDQEYIEHISSHDKKFDIVIVDGAVRYPCAQEAINHLRGRGIIILDNTEWYPNTAKLLNDEGFTQVDFIGFPPINAFPSTTSIFYKDPELLKRKNISKGWKPMGGRFLEAYDDKSFEEIDSSLITS